MGTREQEVATAVVGGLRVALRWPEGWRERVAAPPPPPQRAPAPALSVVVLLHQRLGRKEDLEDVARQAAERGHLAVSWDAANHGERELDQAANEHWLQGNLHNATDMYAQMVATWQELQLVLDFLPAKLGIRFARVSLVGFSQGGHAALLAFTHEPRVDVCVSALSAGDYTLNMAKRYEYFAEVARRKKRAPLPPFDSLFPDALAAAVARFDPIRCCEAAARGARPLLMLNGGADRMVPQECNAALYRALAPRYEAEGRAAALQHVVYDGVRHDITPAMVQAALDWVDRWPLAGRAAAL